MKKLIFWILILAPVVLVLWLIARAMPKTNPRQKEFDDALQQMIDPNQGRQ